MEVVGVGSIKRVWGAVKERYGEWKRRREVREIIEEIGEKLASAEAWLKRCIVVGIEGKLAGDIAAVDLLRMEERLNYLEALVEEVALRYGDIEIVSEVSRKAREWIRILREYESILAKILLIEYTKSIPLTLQRQLEGLLGKLRDKGVF